ncbi:MAG: zinc ribbon domain-containing protein [Candidatus Thorarchaeota archaeon]|nr:zinc ribbon domain-containing protein [Candidatus Thorarchaeota archaeon]
MCRELPNKKQNGKEDAGGLIIAIGVLFIVFLGIHTIYLLIPIFVLVIVLISTLTTENKIKARTSERHRVSDVSYANSYTEKPIYDQWRRKEKGVSLGLLIPIFILGMFFMNADFSWPFLIPLFVLVTIFFGDLVSDRRRGERVRTVLTESHGRTLSEIADGAGLPEDQVIQQVVHEKRRGTADVWFDPATGVATDEHFRDQVERPARGTCVYCGFALRDDDRFCPYCGAPIRGS